MGYAKCHDVIFFLTKKVMLMNIIILAISKHDTLTPLSI